MPPMSANMSNMSLPSNMTNNKGVIPAEKRPDTENTLWYSNEVKSVFFFDMGASSSLDIDVWILYSNFR